MRYFSLLLLVILSLACNDDDEVTPGTTDSPNILLIIADDMGKDATPGFSEGSLKPATPNLDALLNAGLRFNNMWVYPTCTPTRSSIITGKYGYRTEVKWAGDELAQSEVTLQRFLNQETNDQYATAIIGKWHLSGDDSTADPESYGIGDYAGLLRGGVQSYYQWQLTENGAGSLQTEYVTEVFTDLAIDWVDSQTQPWFLWLAYNAPHTPFHVPPAEMHQQGTLPTYTDGLDPLPYYLAAIEAMDFQIGHLLAAIPENELDNTVILFIGDNGTPSQAAQAPYRNNSVKGSLYQGGINVPFFVSGKGVSRSGEDNSLLTSTDLFSTIAELGGASVAEIHDSKSFKPLLSSASTHRPFQYSEMNNGTDDLWTISNGAFKLIVNANGHQELYNLVNDPYEETDLLTGMLSTEEENAKVALEEELRNIRD